MCGEKFPIAASSASIVGSPPRVRGKGHQRNHGARRSGITPACAGKSLYHQLQAAKDWDHPRVCGEKYTGSHCRSERSGITPACAGKRRSSPPWFRSPRDHPRVCGEKQRRKSCGNRNGGSPPRVRGKAAYRRPCPGFDRITPACAGKSLV